MENKLQGSPRSEEWGLRDLVVVSLNLEKHFLAITPLSSKEAFGITIQDPQNSVNNLLTIHKKVDNFVLLSIFPAEDARYKEWAMEEFRGEGLEG